jgi:hypothetical protein
MKPVALRAWHWATAWSGIKVVRIEPGRSASGHQSCLPMRPVGARLGVGYRRGFVNLIHFRVLRPTVGPGMAHYAALWNGTTWTVVPAGGGSALAGVVAAGSTVLATGGTGVWQLSSTGASPQVIPTQNPAQLTAIGADPAGNPWAVGWTDAQGTIAPGIINAPGIGQGGITVTTGAANATVSWIGPANGTGTTDVGGRFATGGLPDGSYTVIASLQGCQPGVASANVTAGTSTPVNAQVICPP